MEKELEQEKAKFFNLYRGQEVFVLTGLSQIKNKPYDTVYPEDHLSLTPLSLISDEQLSGLAKIIFPELKGWMIALKKGIYREIQSNEGTGILIDLHDCFISWEFGEDASGNPNILAAYQHLIQSGYAVDWYSSALKRTIKVEEQIELGWVKLKEG